MQFLRSLIFLPLIVAMPVMAQQATVVRDSELKEDPYGDAQTVAVLKAKEKVEVGERRGGWYQVKGKRGKNGWLRLTAVLLNSTQGKGDSGIAATKQFLESGRSGSSGVTAATGIRGLDAADVVNANPDTAAVARLDAVTIDSDEARRFAAEARLSARSIDYLPEEK